MPTTPTVVVRFGKRSSNRRAMSSHWRRSLRARSRGSLPSTGIAFSISGGSALWRASLAPTTDKEGPGFAAITENIMNLTAEDGGDTTKTVLRSFEAVLASVAIGATALIGIVVSFLLGERIAG